MRDAFVFMSIQHAEISRLTSNASFGVRLLRGLLGELMFTMMIVLAELSIEG